MTANDFLHVSHHNCFFPSRLSFRPLRPSNYRHLHQWTVLMPQWVFILQSDELFVGDISHLQSSWDNNRVER